MCVHRVLDANVNRACEGLRVLEEIARFLLGHAGMATRAKDLRHRLRTAVPAAAVADRDTAGDVGTAIQGADEGRREHLPVLLRANAQRVAEALRAIEEFAKLAPGPLAAAIEALRYLVYDLERDLLARLPAWRLWQERLYVLVDTSCTDDPVGVAAAAARGGAGVIQLRAKALDQRAYRELAARVQEAVAGRALFVVNDHAAVARILAADALHLGQDDLEPADARLVVGPLCALGVSTHHPEQLERAQAAGADYVGIGPMYSTTTKPHEAVRGPGLLAAVAPCLRVPSYAIGGLDAERIAGLKGRIPHGVAVAGAICRAPDPERACAELREVLER